MTIVDTIVVEISSSCGIPPYTTLLETSCVHVIVDLAKWSTQSS